MKRVIHVGISLDELNLPQRADAVALRTLRVDPGNGPKAGVASGSGRGGGAGTG